MKPKIIEGENFSDTRGTLTFNNDFNASEIKRVYTIQNKDLDFVRGWQGHTTEQRWFSAILGTFEIKLIAVDNWESPSKLLISEKFLLNSSSLDILHIPAGYISSIQALEEGSKLLVMADYGLGETSDEFRFPSDYFEQED